MTETSAAADTEVQESNTPSAEPGPHVRSVGGRLGRYVLIDVLGTGGMGVVYSAFDPRLDRGVAVKVLKHDVGTEVDRQRLLREAKAMAKLTHPNVVAVYDAGDENGEVYVAMEFVRGSSLRRVLAKRPSTRDILAIFLQAGRGLAAAHAAGIIHRDFKPDNVLITEDGVAKVADFGLARAGETGPQDVMSLVDADTLRRGETLLTRAGVLVGTPMYMSPEQFFGLAADARSDQFSFCVALFESLVGEPPFTGNNLAELAANVTSGTRRSDKGPDEIPAWLMAVVDRGLRPNREERWPSMDALLAALATDPVARRRHRQRLVLGISVAMATVAGGALYADGEVERRAAAMAEREAHACDVDESEFAGAWDGTRRSSVQKAFAAAGLPYVGDTVARVEQALDDYRASWLVMHREACLAHRRGEQSGEFLDLRMSCLAERRQAMRALVDVFGTADALVIERASTALASLPRIESCGDLGYLRARMRPPDDPSAASRVTAVRAGLANARALEQAGRYDEGLDRVEGLAAEAAEIGYRPLQIELDVQRGSLLVDKGDWTGAEAVLDATFYEARALGHDAAAIEAATWLVPAVGHGRTDFVQAERWLRQADAEIRHAGEPGQDVELLGVAAAHHILRGDYEAGLHDFERAIERRRALDGDWHPSLVVLYGGLGSALFKRGRMAEASAALERALAVGEVALGPEHPQIGHVLGRIGMIASRERRFDAAAASLERALAISERSLGPEHPRVMEVLSYLGELEIRRHDFGQAIAYLRRATDLAMTVDGEEHAHVANFLGSLSIALFKAGRTDEALAAAERALAIGEARLGPEHPNTAIFAGNLGEILNDRGRFTEARPHLERALKDLERALGESQPDLGPIHREVARALLGVGEIEQALVHARRAVELGREGGVEPDEIALSSFVLAKVLAVTSGSTTECRALAEVARDYFRKNPDVTPGKAAEIEAWLATQKR